jgi:hypothetical protein
MPSSTQPSRPRAPPKRREQQPAATVGTTSTKDDDGAYRSYSGYGSSEDTAWRTRLWRRGGGCLAYGYSYGAA